MRTSLVETKEIEDFLTGSLLPEESALFKARLILQPDLAAKVTSQARVYRLVQAYGRKQLKAELQRTEEKLFSEARHRSFREKILRLFK